MQQTKLRTAKLWIFIVLIASLASTALPIIVHADPSAILAVEPTAVMKSSGQTFTINVTVADVVNLGGFEFNMSWNPDVLNVTDLRVGSFFPQFFVFKNQSWWYDPAFEEPLPPGQLWFAVTMPLGTPAGGGKTGNGTIAEVTFTVKPGATGTSPLDLWGTSLATMEKPPQPIEHEVKDGEFSIELPIALFDYSPANPQVGNPVTFNASESYKAGGTIIRYKWDFGDGTTETYVEGENLTAIATHTYSQEGTYLVNLTITDDTQLTNWKTSEITVSPPEVPRHDVAITSVDFTPKTVAAGGDVVITVKAKNNGTFTETFNVTVYYDETQIDVQTVTDLSPGATDERTFTWNTAGVSEGIHTIRAEASAVEGESDADKANNVRSGGTIRIQVETGSQNIYIYVGAAVGIAAVAVAAFYLVKIRKPKTT